MIGLSRTSRRPAALLALVASLAMAGCATPDPEGKARDGETPANAPAPASAEPKGMSRAEVAAARAEAEKRYDGFLKGAKSDAERRMLEEQRVKSRKLFDEFERGATR